jgi:hypothetical protein
MVLPSHNRELALWLMRECIADFMAMGKKMHEIETGKQKYSDEKEWELDAEFGCMVNSPKEYQKRLDIQNMCLSESRIDLFAARYAALQELRT